MFLAELPHTSWGSNPVPCSGDGVFEVSAVVTVFFCACGCLGFLVVYIVFCGWTRMTVEIPCWSLIACKY